MQKPLGQQLLDQIMDDYRRDQLVLPSIPDVALRVRNAVSDSSKTARQIAQIIQIEPALTARLIQISNGPMSRGASKIDSCQAAITRLGFRVTQNLVMSITFRNMFSAKQPVVRQRMEEHWKGSSKVGAICFVLAGISHGLEQDRALMAGIVHEIGVLPILRYADQYPELIKHPEILDKIIHRLKTPLGTLILNKWNFGDDIKNIPQEVNDWMRNTGEKADYADIVLVAKVHSLFGKEENTSVPPLTEMPAFQKLPLSHLGPGGSIELLNQAQGEVDAILKILNG